MGPVQVLVVGFDEPNFTGDVLAEFERLTEAGIVRLIDVLVVDRREDGSLHTVDAADSASGVLATGLLTGNGTGDGVGDDAAWSLADAVPPGSAAAVALIEHIWAAPLAAAIVNAGGIAREETWLAPDDVAQLENLIAQRTNTTT